MPMKFKTFLPASRNFAKKKYLALAITSTDVRFPYFSINLGVFI